MLREDNPNNHPNKKMKVAMSRKVHLFFKSIILGKFYTLQHPNSSNHVCFNTFSFIKYTTSSLSALYMASVTKAFKR